MNPHPRARRLLGVLPRPAVVEWICLIVGLFLTNQYAWLLDDAFVYFRYVDNAIFLDYGLVYNAGEYVEGYSSPLWTLILLTLRGVGLNYWVLVRLVGALSFIAFWALLVVLNRRIRPRDDSHLSTVNFPLCFLTVNYGVSSYFTSGLESPLVQVAAALYALFFVNPRSKTIQLLLGLTPILRHELAIPFALAWLYAVVARRRVPITMTLSGLLVTLGWVLFRVTYYADLFPNTFYLKNASDIGQGLRYLHDTALPYGLYFIFPSMIALAFWLHRKGVSWNPAPRILMLACALPVLLFVIRIGGDPRHYRYLAFPLCLSLCATSGLVELSLQRVPRWNSTRFATGLGLFLMGLSFAARPLQLGGHPASGDVPHTIRHKISDASLHRHHASLRHDPWGIGAEIEQKHRYASYRRPHPNRPYRELDVGWWCVTQYRKFDARAIHALGLTDPILARTEMPAERPAHKEGLRPLAIDIAQIHYRVNQPAGPGMYRAAIQAGVAAPWIAKNLASIELIEEKMYNRHDFATNLALAFRFPKPIQP